MVASSMGFCGLSEINMMMMILSYFVLFSSEKRYRTLTFS